MNKDTFRVVTRGANGQLRIKDYVSKESLLRLHYSDRRGRLQYRSWAAWTSRLSRPDWAHVRGQEHCSLRVA